MRITRTLTLLLTATATLTAVLTVGASTLSASTSALPVATKDPQVTAPLPTTTTTPTTTPLPTSPAPSSSPATLRPGASGPEVLALQRRLSGLGYWLGTPDGSYNSLTMQAVTAFQKVEGLVRDGLAGPAARAALSGATRPTVDRDGDLVEVDKSRQVLFVVRNGRVDWTLNVSTGTEKPYRVNGRTEMADTPVGEWRIGRVVDGVKKAELGSLYRPRYFHSDGIAVHGARDVPAYPASHGCVRVTNAAMNWIWSAEVMPVGSLVVVS